ncbi:MAG: peptidoglycan DD-metalloendopeptidase family protein [Caldimonas sp.]
MLLIETSSVRVLRSAALVAAAAIVAGCTNFPHRAPVEERTGTPRATVAAASPATSPVPSAEPVKPVVPDNNSGRPGYYTVKSGDTLIRIGLDNGQNWKDLVRWNNLDNPNLIEVGQVLRVVPPGVDPASAMARPVNTARVDTRALDARPVPAASGPTSGPPAAPAPLVVTPIVVPTPAAAAPPREGDDDVSWGWPVAGPVSTPFDEARNKGLVFRGKAGDPVLAAADGRVVYAGSGLRGYGNLVILKHNATYLTAYAHNQTLLVKDDQAVKKGQKIAEMGSSDADGVQLHFEIRRQGKPIDPGRLLPQR